LSCVEPNVEPLAVVSGQSARRFTRANIRWQLMSFDRFAMGVERAATAIASIVTNDRCVGFAR